MGKHSSVLFKASDYLSPRFWPMWCVIGVLRLVSLLPYHAQLRVGAGMGRLLMRINRNRMSVIDTNLARCFPEKSTCERDRIRYDCFRNIGISLIEMGLCWWWPPEKLKPLVEIRGKEHIDAAIAAGRGPILLTGHYTSLEIGGRLLTLFMPLQALYRTQRNALFDSYLFTKRSSYLTRLISRKHTLQLIKGLKSCIPTWYAPDQNFRRERNVFAPFMGIPAATLTASSRLAQSSGAVMLPYYPERKADGNRRTFHSPC